MAKINRTKGNIRLLLSKEELNTITIAMALINIQDMETEAQEQGLSLEEVSYNHNTLFDELTKFSKLYPTPEA